MMARRPGGPYQHRLVRHKRGWRCTVCGHSDRTKKGVNAYGCPANAIMDKVLAAPNAPRSKQDIKALNAAATAYSELQALMKQHDGGTQA